MNSSIRPIRARAVVPAALFRALHWKLLLLWVLATLGCALLAAVPAWSWLGSVLDHSLQSDAIAVGKAPMRMIDALMAPTAPLTTLSGNIRIAALLMLLLSPLLVGATLVAARSAVRPGFGDLLRGAIGEFWPLLRLLLWSILPLGAAVMAGSAMYGLNAKLHEHAILASEVSRGSDIAMVVGIVLFVLAHASVEAGRGWLAADVNLRSAIKAWWRGAVLLARRPIAVLSAYLVPWILASIVAVALLWLRQRTGGGLLLGLLFSCLIGAALAWGKVARLYALRALAESKRRID